ncbi:sigma-54 dependent transcriptional regulator [Myxococcota bacterium]|nr:sigma-54 dependent transcriptional regulator [Myxococcota bacterium]
MSPPATPRLGPPLRALVVDDERNIRSTLALCLETCGCEPTAVATADEALRAIARARFDLAFLDLRLAERSGLDLLDPLLAAQADLRVVIITAYATVDTAVSAMRRGAWDYLPKPFTPAQIRRFVDQVAERRALDLRVAELESRLADAVPEVDLTSVSPAMAAALDVVHRAAPFDVPVLLRGESGTGKGVFARALHARSARARAAFVVVNCPTLTEEMLAGELFGHARGAFTGAVRDQPGRVEAAEGGTLFLDEISEITPSLQAKLLRFLQDRQFERIGETRTRTADVRIVAATNRDIEDDVRTGRFREDLLYRLDVIEVRIPALRERPEDIPRLAAHFLAFFARAARRPALELSPAARDALLAYPWPGNVRELRNAMERAVILWQAPVLEPAGLPERIVARADAGPRLGGEFTLEAIEREHIQRVVARAPTFEEAARVLGIESSTLWRKRKRYEAPD